MIATLDFLTRVTVLVIMLLVVLLALPIIFFLGAVVVYVYGVLLTAILMFLTGG